MRVLAITTEFPTPEVPGRGVFIMRQIDALRAAGVEIDVLKLSSQSNPLNHLRALRELRRMMREKDYDLIHGHFSHSLFGARLQFRVPIVATFRGSGTYGIIGPDGGYTFKGRILQLMSQLVALAVDQVIVVSEDMGQRLWRRSYTVIPSGLDLDRFSPMPREEARRRLRWPPDRPIVIFAALRISAPRKRYALAESAIRLASEELGSDIELRAATDITPQEMPLYMNAADALLLTSIYEGSPNVVKEALACNLPVVSTRVGDVPERLAEVSPSAVCDDTSSALAAALVPILRHPARSNGRESVESLAEPLLAQRVLQVYREALRR